MVALVASSVLFLLKVQGVFLRNTFNTLHSVKDATIAVYYFTASFSSNVK